MQDPNPLSVTITSGEPSQGMPHLDMPRPPIQGRHAGTERELREAGFHMNDRDG
jgi:hypothetical protein